MGFDSNNAFISYTSLLPSEYSNVTLQGPAGWSNSTGMYTRVNSYAVYNDSYTMQTAFQSDLFDAKYVAGP